MITLITGPIHSGKTTRLIEEFQKCSKGDGYASVKMMNGNIVEGFDLMRLSTGDRMPLARKANSLSGEWKQCCSLGPYSFSEDAVSMVNAGIDIMLKDRTLTIFLDEIGSLELGDMCFHEAVKKIAGFGAKAVLTVRDTNLQDVIEKYGFIDIKIIETGERFA
ncbi:MAG: hypothetical protein JXN10_06970 [Clostridia bacterium]|nr:hypothetical protein [Clostridia bacterium]MBN2883254.1 hypothetical protein [Clostridia bacterium]